MPRRRCGGEIVASVFDRLDAVMQRFVDQGKVAGAVSLVGRRGGTWHLRAQGVMGGSDGAPMRPDALFRIASLTQPITATAVLMLVEQGLLSLDRPAATVLPELGTMSVLVDPADPASGSEPATRSLTIEHLLTHTGGLAYGIYEDGPVELRYRDAGILDRRLPLRLAHPLATLPERLAALPLCAQPGAVWRHGLGYDLLGSIVERVSGLTLSGFMSERLFDPLGMVDTAFIVPTGSIGRLTQLQAGPNGRLHRVLDGRADSAFRDADTGPSGGRGLVTTAPDLARFLRMVINGGELDGYRYVSAETVAMMTRNRLPSSMLPISVGPFSLPGMGYGLGFAVCLDPARWSGGGSCGICWWLGETGAFAWADPVHDLVGVYMTQTMGYYDPGIVFQDQVYRALGLHPRRHPAPTEVRRDGRTEGRRRPTGAPVALDSLARVLVPLGPRRR